MPDSAYKRINIMVLEDQYHVLSERGLNISGLIRDLLGDYLSENSVTVQVGEETRQLYDTVVANTGATDQEIEVHLREALARVLEDRINQMQHLHRQLVDGAPPPMVPKE